MTVRAARSDTGTLTAPETQLQLVDVAPEDPEERLTPRQRFALQVVRDSGTSGVYADDVGAAWDAQRGKHSVDTRCDWCGSNGLQVLKALRKHGYVRSRRGERGTPSVWIALDTNGKPAAKTTGPADGWDDLIKAGF